MKKASFCILALFCMLVAFNVQAQVKQEPGVSKELAEFRAKHVSHVVYDLSFEIPDSVDKRVSGSVTVYFDYDGSGLPLQLDFQGFVAASMRVNVDEIETTFEQEHILIPSEYLRRGQNVVSVDFISQDKALNRADDYLYTLFVPDHARSAFPCFDQPDIKALFNLSLRIPAGWTAISNGKVIEKSSIDGGRSSAVRFGITEPLPTYLFSFTAGKFFEQKVEREGRELTALYRETDTAKVAQLPIIFDEIALSLRWMEQYTGIRMPFQQYGFVILPGYQFGGMEHPGCIQFKDQTLFLGPTPTPDEEMNRLHLLAHETAHLWFGDLVTMRWFNDVWTKEVFANFMADKIAREQYPDINHDLSFIRTHYIPAFSTDRTLGTHPIQQPLANLNQAGLLYGNIIYHKAPIMMRKLELQMGGDAFQRGLQRYLKQFSFSNATWDDLIEILDSEAPDAQIQSFDQLWVKQKGVPTQVLDPQQSVLPNLDGMDYVRYLLPDSVAVDAYIARWLELTTVEGRVGAAMMLYDNYLMQRATPRQTMQALHALCSQETNELALSAYGRMVASVLSRYPDSEREALEQTLWQFVNNHPVKAFRQQMLRSMSQIVTSEAICDSVYQIWKEQHHPLLNTRNYMAMAYHLAIMRPSQWQEIVEEQRSRLANADLLREFDFISRACTPDSSEQDRLFESLLQKENRAVEPYASALLLLLNDSSREPYNNKYITPALESLEEIQQTGDIFFPLSWCQSLLAGHRSREAAALVLAFLDSHPAYPEQLRNKLLQAAFVLMNLK